jgi:hypothetical protein
LERIAKGKNPKRTHFLERIASTELVGKPNKRFIYYDGKNLWNTLLNRKSTTHKKPKSG